MRIKANRIQIFTTETQLAENWTLRNENEIYSVTAEAEVIRMKFNQIVHHRAQLGVYLRLLNVITGKLWQVLTMGVSYPA